MCNLFNGFESHWHDRNSWFVLGVVLKWAVSANRAQCVHNHLDRLQSRYSERDVPQLVSMGNAAVQRTKN